MSTAPWSDVRRAWLALLVLTALAAAPARAAAPEPDAAVVAGQACGYALSGPIWNKWTAMGGEKGLLGCPQARESAALPSPTGSAGREVTFGAGEGAAIFGPVISTLPSDDDAVELWRHVSWLARYENFSELKRDRPQPPDLPAMAWRLARRAEKGAR